MLEQHQRLGTLGAHDFMGKDGFYWWFGVVEDRRDPLQLGRAKVRIFGYHNMDPDVLPTEQLPWALALSPLGNHEVPKSPPESTWVFGFFIDGALAQQPAMIASVPGLRYKDVVSLNIAR